MMSISDLYLHAPSRCAVSGQDRVVSMGPDRVAGRGWRGGGLDLGNTLGGTVAPATSTCLLCPHVTHHPCFTTGEETPSMPQ